MSSTFLFTQGIIEGTSQIRTHRDTPPIQVPSGHVGPVALPGSGRMVWWTGRVAIGLRHQPMRNFESATQSALWVQTLMLHGGRDGLAGA
jgi:hypothetical protein